MKNLLVLLSIITLSISLGQVYPREYTIRGVSFEGPGMEFLDPRALQLISGLTTNSKVTIPGDDIAQAIRKLWEENLFDDISVEYEKVIGKDIFLKVTVVGRPRVSEVRYPTLSKSEANKINDEVKTVLYRNKLLSDFVLGQAKRKVVNYFQDKGFYKVKVETILKMDTNRTNTRFVLFNIDKGPRVKIKTIEFIGLDVVKERKLLKAMENTKQRGIMRIFGKSKFIDVDYEADKRALANVFQEYGLRDGTVVKDSIFYYDEKNMGIVLWVEEGGSYYFGDINWVGNTKYSSGFLDTVLGIKKGELYNSALFEQRLFMSEDGRDITALYQDDGYLFFQITPIEKRVYNDTIDYEIRIVEGKQATVNRVIIKGNTRTSDFVIRRELRTKPGELFSRNDIIRTQRELSALNLFDMQAFQVNPIPNPYNGTVDIEYTVVEKSSDQIELSGGYGGGRLLLSLGLSFNNFSFRNFFKGWAWQPLPSGDGQKLAIRAQTNGRYYQAYTLSFTEPWLGGKKPIAFSVVGSYSNQTNGLNRNAQNFQGLQIFTGAVGIGHRLKWPDDYWQAYHELGYQYYDINNYQIGFLFNDGYSNVFSYKLVLTRNSIDAPIYPTRGSKFTITGKVTPPYSVFRGEEWYADATDQDRYLFAEYFKLKTTAEWFAPLTKDKKLVFRTKIGFGFLGTYSSYAGDAPFERYILGGSGLTGFSLDGREVIGLRGYPDQGVSPQTGSSIVAKYVFELRYPISLNPSATIFALAFAEAGNTWNQIQDFNPFQVKRSVGLGVRVFLPMFGLLGVDYGFGFDYLSPQDTGSIQVNPSIATKGYYGQFHFVIGANIGEL